MKKTTMVEIFKTTRCPLCDEALAIIHKVRQRLSFNVKVTDIGHSPFLYEQFRYEVPVVFVDGVKLFVHHVNEEVLEARLKERLFHNEDRD